MSAPELLLVEVRVRPRSRPGWARDANDRLVLGVAAAPADGAANEEARRSIAKAFELPLTRISLHRGARSREKVFAISHADAAAVGSRIERLGRPPR